MQPEDFLAAEIVKKIRAELYETRAQDTYKLALRLEKTLMVHPRRYREIASLLRQLEIPKERIKKIFPEKIIAILARY